MSTDPLPSPTRSDQRQRFRFRRLSLGLIVILAVAAGGLGAVNAVQGPQLSSAEVNPQALITRAGQRVLLHTNQPVSDISLDEVKISPPAAAEIIVDQNTITVRFTNMLSYNTDYTVTIDARGASTGAAGTLALEFSTPDIDVFSLLRDTRQDAAGQDRPDQVLRHSLSQTTSNEVVFDAPRIQEYVTLGALLVVVTLNRDNLPSLVLTSPSDGIQSPIDTAGANTIRQLQAADSGDLFGYILDAGYSNPDGPKNTLFIYDLAGGTGVPTPVRGFGGDPLAVMDWIFVPGTTSIVIQGEDQQLYLIDPLAGGDPTPLGQHTEMRGFVPGTVQLVVADPLSGSVIDLASGTTAILDLPEPHISADLYPGKLLLLGEDSYIELYTEIKPGVASSHLTSLLVLTDADGSRELYRTTSAGSRIRDYCLSPNGEYLAVEIISGEGTPDNYPLVNGYSASSISFVLLGDGSSGRGVNGFLPDWCRSDL